MRSPVILLTLTATLLTPHPAWAVTDEQVAQAISRMQDWLYARQDAQTGGWVQRQPYHQPQAHERGETALIVMALLLSGESVQEKLVPATGETGERTWANLSRPERLHRAVAYLNAIGYEGFNGTYSVSIRMHCWSLMPPDSPDRSTLREQDARWLLRAHRNSLFDYGPVYVGRFDHSTTLFGVLGLWQYARQGGRVPPAFWSDAARHFIAFQEDDGGWAYQPGTGQRSRGSMTAAGLTILLIAQQQLYRADDRPPAELTRAIDRATAWLDAHFTGLDHPGFDRYRYYWLYNLERAALLSGVKHLNGRDWFEIGARDILANLQPDGSINASQVDTAFALAFLARGRVPVWVTKLHVPGHNWNNRPNDMHMLTEHLSHWYERDRNWQVVSIDTDHRQWRTPVAYIASDQAVTLNQRQKQNLKAYLDAGGTLLASADNRSQPFIESMRQLAAELYPRYQLRAAEAGDAIASTLHRVPQEQTRHVLVLSNGVRELIVISTDDWGMSFQSQEPSHNHATWRMICNLFANTTHRNNLPNRLERTTVARLAHRTRTGDIAVVRARHGASWNAEPAAWGPMRDFLFNRTGLELSVKEQALAEIGSSNAALVHLAGIDATELSEAELRAIRQYTHNGGTLLVETIGGRGRFSLAIERQLRQTFGDLARPLPTSSMIITGEDLRGGYDNRRVLHRPHAVLRYSADTRPYLAAFTVDGRPAVIFSHADLSLGMLGARHWDINGYSIDSARQVMINLLLAAQQTRNPP